MEISPKQIKKREIVGKLGDSDVWRLKAIGGLYIAATTGPKGKILATAPHPGMLEFLAEKSHPDIKWNGLAKSEKFAPEALDDDLVVRYEALTEILNKYYK